MLFKNCVWAVRVQAPPMSFSNLNEGIPEKHSVLQKTGQDGNTQPIHFVAAVFPCSGLKSSNTLCLEAEMFKYVLMKLHMTHILQHVCTLIVSNGTLVFLYRQVA